MSNFSFQPDFSRLRNLNQFSADLKSYATPAHESKVLTVFHAIGSQTDLDDLTQSGARNRRQLTIDGVLPATGVTDRNDQWRERLLYAGLKEPDSKYTFVAFTVRAGDVSVGNQSLARNGLHQVPPEYMDSVMPLSEYLARIEIASDSPRHPVTALPLDGEALAQVRQEFGLVGYCAEVLIESGIVSPSEFSRVNRGE